jgi:hypothetical protein
MHEDFYKFYLNYIFRHPNTSAEIIARNTKCTAATTHAVIDELKKKGFITTDEDTITLSSKGLSFLEKNELISLPADKKQPGTKKQPWAIKSSDIKIALQKGNKLVNALRYKKGNVRKNDKKGNLEIASWIFGVLAIIIALALVLVVFGKKPV